MKAFAADHDIPILHLKKPDRTRWDDRKLDHVRPYLEAAEAEGRFGVVAIVATQEFQWVFSAKNRSSKPGVVSFDFVKEERRVGMYYFYVLDPEFGPGFIKICTYFPYPAKVWLNGHEWAKRQARREQHRFCELANGFASCDDPGRPPGHLRPLRPGRRPGLLRPLDPVIPTPFTDADRAAGYFWELSMRQVEVSPHPGLRRPPPGPGLLRVPRRRQHRHRPPRRGPCRVRSRPRGVRTTHSPSATGSSPRAPR